MMDTFKFILFSIVVLVFLGLVGYWAVHTIQNGSEHVTTQKMLQLEQENEDLKNQVASLSDELDKYKNDNISTTDTTSTTPTPVIPAPKVDNTKPATTTTTPSTTSTTTTTTTTTKPSTTPKPSTTTYKNQSLIDELSKLVTDKVTMKLHSVGSRVGTIEKFLNLYNKTSNKIDNDYGASTVKAVAAFEKDMGITPADGTTTSTTYNRMIDWLKKQG